MEVPPTNIKNSQSKLPPEVTGGSGPRPELEALELELDELVLALEELELEELEPDCPHVEGFSGICNVKVCGSGATRMGSPVSV